MIVAVFLVELMHYSQNQASYPSIKAWAVKRWDNLTVSFVSGVLLCMVAPVAVQHEVVTSIIDLQGYDPIVGMIIGLSSTPIVNAVMKRTKAKIKE
jgi:cellobiose-specific phosphotransferase system component IIC